MARISTYAIDGTLASSDKLIGTDSSGTITKNYPLGSVSDWLKESGASAVLGQNNYTFQIAADPDTGRLPGTISFANYGGDGTAFSNITTFRLSKISSTGKNVANYLLSTVGDKVILGQLDDLNNFGVYTLVSLTQNSSETGFYDAALLFVEGNGALVGNGIYGLATHSASESAVWGNIEGTVTNQTDLVNYIDAEIAAIPAPATPTLQTVTNAGNTTTNNIGIGASSPTEKLDVAGNIKLRGTNNLTIGSTGSGGNFSLSSGIRGYNFSNNNGDLLRIDSAGKVGIGTTSPSTKLHILGTAPVVKIEGDGVTSAYLNFETNEVERWNIGVPSGYSRLNFNNGTSDLFTMLQSGNVGIGTTSPETKLSVAGGKIQLENNQEITWSDIGDGNTGRVAIRGSEDDDYILFRTDNAERMRINSSGNVGIGTTSPGSKLAVAGRVDFQNDLRLRGTDSAANQGVTRFFVDSSNKLHIDTANDGNNLFVIDSTGKVGIGTTSPGKTLDIAGEIRTSGRATFNEYVNTSLVYGNIDLNLGYAGGTSGIFIKGSGALAGNVGIGTTTPSTKLHVSGSGAIVYAGGTASNNEIVVERITSSPSKLQLQAFSSNPSIKFTANGNGKLRFLDSSDNERVTFLESGRVGIGRPNPSHQLHVVTAGWDGIKVESTTANGALLNLTNTQRAFELSSRIIVFQIRDITASDAARFMVDASGNVGIGTTSPSYKLDISTTNGTSPLKLEDTSTSYKSFSVDYSSAFVTTLKFGLLGRLSYDGNGGVMNIINASSQSGTSSTRFIMGGNEKMRITNTGNVGIGTTSPGVPLDVTGVIRTTTSFVGNASIVNQVTAATSSGSIKFKNHSGVDRAIITDAGNVGIGTTSPTRKLDVAGDMNLASSAVALRIGGTAVLGVLNGLTRVNGTGGASGGIAFTPNNDNNEKMRITYTGNVGIGTTAPDVALEVAGTIKASTHADGLVFGSPTTVKHKLGVYGGNDLLFKDPNNNVLMALTSAGNVGIGTTSPSTKLQLKGNSTYITINNNSNHNSVQVGSDSSGDGALFLRDSSGNNKIYLSGESNTNNYINSGNIGVGTTAPNSKVHINGTAMEQLRMQTSGGPGSSSATNGRVGDMAYDDDYFYIKTANGWGRIALDFGF